MPLIDYSKPMTFCDSAEAVSVVLNHALIRLRDHANFQEDKDDAVLHAAEILSALLEDAQVVVERLIGKMVVE